MKVANRRHRKKKIRTYHRKFLLIEVNHSEAKTNALSPLHNDALNNLWNKCFRGNSSEQI